MKIYIAHSRDIDYVNKLYKPLRNDDFFAKYDLILPHETKRPNNSRDFYSTIDILIAECSEVSTGLGIELGFAYDDNVKIYCIYQNNKKVSSSIKAVTNNFYEYKDVEDMVNIIKQIIIYYEKNNQTNRVKINK